MRIKNLLGLRFPDDYIIRMFFKLGLHSTEGKSVIEFGCGNGNNLSLFQEFGWRVTGIDLDEEQLGYAKHNLDDNYVDQLLTADLSNGIPNLEVRQFDALLFPNINYYLPRSSFINLLKNSRSLMSENAVFFIRCRTPQDWRFNKGREVEKNGFVLDLPETGEQGLLNVFYEPDELEDLIFTHLGTLHDFQRLHVSYDNPQNGITVRNTDIVFWGRV